MTQATGIVWAGAVFDRGGYGNVSRNYVLALRHAKVPVRIFNLGHVHGEIDPETAAIMQDLSNSDVGKSPIGVVHSLPTFIPQVKFKGIAGTVSASIFETDSIPAGWADLSNGMDQVWVPTQFNLDTYSKAGVRKEKLRVIPIPIDCQYFKPGIPG